MRKPAITFIFILSAVFLFFSFTGPAFAASANFIDRVPQINVGHEFNNCETVPRLQIKEKCVGDFSNNQCFRLTLENAEWLEREITTAGAINATGANVDVKYLTMNTIEITIADITSENNVEIRVPLLSKITAEGEAKVTVDSRDSSISAGTYVFAVAGVGKTVATIEKVENFSHITTLATIRIDETRIGALGNTTGQSITLKLPSNFTWVNTAEAIFLGSGGLADVVVNYIKGSNTETLELSYNPLQCQNARGSIFLQGLQIQADKFAPYGDVVVRLGGTNITATELTVARRTTGMLNDANLVGIITGAKKCPAAGIWEYKCNPTTWELDLSVIEETTNGPINHNFITVSSYSGVEKDDEAFKFIHVAEMKMLTDSLEHKVYAFAWGNASVFEVSFLPDTTDNKKQFLSVFDLDFESALEHIKNIIADDGDVFYGRPSVICLQGQPVSPITPPCLVQIMTNPKKGGAVTGYGIYEYGNNVTITATPNSGYKFEKWIENGTVVSCGTSYSFIVTKNHKLTADFSKSTPPPTSGGGGGGGSSATPPPLQKQVGGTEFETNAVVGPKLIATKFITNSAGETVEILALKKEAKKQIEKAQKEGASVIEIKTEKFKTPVVAFLIPLDVLKGITEIDLAFNTQRAVLRLPKELIKTIIISGQDLFIQVENVEVAAVNKQMEGVTETTGAEILGVPVAINTGIEGCTDISLPLSNFKMPTATTEQQAFLETLCIFAIYKDGEKKIIAGTIEVDATGSPAGINFATEKCGTFAIIKMPEVITIEKPLAVKLTIDQLKTIVNGKNHILDACPFIKTGKSNRAMVPIRFIGEALGAEVKWRDSGRQVEIKKSQNTIILTVGSKKVLANNSERVSDFPAEVLPPGRTFVPLRFVSENLGAKVSYNPNNKEITIVKNE